MARRKKQKNTELLTPPLDQTFDQHIQQLQSPNKDQGYGALVRRTVFFQFRLAADGIRDLLLSPICVIAALMGLFRPNNPSWALDRLMQFGRVSDRWINLFEQEHQCPAHERSQTIDDLFEHVERKVKTTMDPDTPPEESSWASSFSAAAGNKRPHL